jgi:hypothetical protein
MQRYKIILCVESSTRSICVAQVAYSSLYLLGAPVCSLVVQFCLLWHVAHTGSHAAAMQMATAAVFFDLLPE